jgi:serine/threonine-protein kinase SRPK3
MFPDLTTSNLLVQLSNFDSWSQEDIYARFGKAKKDPVATMSGDCPGPSAPSYVVDSLNFAKIKGQYLEESIVIIDFGQAFFFGNPPIDGVGTPLSYCAPEAILELKASAASDLWALACCIFEVRARYQLFSTFFGTSREVLLQMVKTLGRLPSPWWEDWKGRSLYFDEHGDPKKRANGAPWAVPFPLKEVLEGVNKEMKDGFMDPENRGCEIEGVIWELSRTKLSPAEIAQMEDLLERLLKFAPEERLSADEACNHAWFHEEERH